MVERPLVSSTSACLQDVHNFLKNLADLPTHHRENAHRRPSQLVNIKRRDNIQPAIELKPCPREYQ
jgi:hypothetical protein